MLLVWPVKGWATNYVFTTIVVSGDTMGGKTLAGFGGLDLNNAGEVAFAASFSGGNGIFTGSGVVALTGDTIGGKTLTIIPIHPTINDSGVVAFQGYFSGGQGIFTGSGPVALTGDTIAGKTLTYLFLPLLLFALSLGPEPPLSGSRMRVGPLVWAGVYASSWVVPAQLPAEKAGCCPPAGP